MDDLSLKELLKKTIPDSDKFEVYWQIDRNGVPICEGEDVFLYINENIYTKITKFVDFFFNTL